MAVREQIYRAGSGVGQGAPLPMAGDEAFGAGVGRGIGQLGGAMHEAQVRAIARETERQREAANAQAAADFATRAGEIEIARNQRREEASADAGGHVDTVRNEIAARRQAHLESITDERVRQRWTAQWAELEARVVGDEDGWARGRRVKALGENIEVAGDGWDRAMLSNPDPKILEQALSAGDTMLDGLGYGEAITEPLRREYRARREAAYLEGLIEKDPGAATAVLESGVLTHITPEQIVRLKDKADTEVRIVAADVRRQASAAAAEWVASTRVLIEDVDHGVEVDPEELKSRAARARELGEEGLAQDLDRAVVHATVAGEFKKASIPELEAERREIEGKPDWQKDRQLVEAHTKLGAMVDQRRTAAKQDPVKQYFEQTGRSLPPIDLNDPAIVNAYVAAGEAAHRLSGGAGEVKYMPEAVAEPLREQFKSGGVDEKAATIETLAAHGRRKGGVLMRQIAPGEPRYAALLDLASMRDRNVGRIRIREAIGGWEQLKANPKLIDQQLLRDQLDDLATPLRGLPGAARQGVLDVANGLYAQRATRQGLTDFEPALWREALEDALGRSGNTGGITDRGDGRDFILPRGATHQDVVTVFARASGEQIMAAAFGGRDAPIWAGRTMTPLEFKRLVPVLVGDDNGRAVYWFRNETGFVQSQKRPGENFALDMRELYRLVAGRR
jgi:hypothetical protein